MTTAASKKCPC